MSIKNAAPEITRTKTAVTISEEISTVEIKEGSERIGSNFAPIKSAQSTPNPYKIATINFGKNKIGFFSKTFNEIESGEDFSKPLCRFCEAAKIDLGLDLSNILGMASLLFIDYT